MNESLRMVIVLTLIAIISGGSLALVDNATKVRIGKNKVKALKEGLNKLIPAATEFEKIEVEYEGKTFVVYKALKQNRIIGWGFLLAGPGFQATIEIVAATNREITSIYGIEVLEQKETPGLGAKIVREDFKKQFDGLSIEREIGYVKNQKPEPCSNDIQAISAATISTEKLLDILNKNLKKLREMEEIKKQLRENK